jgi:hypothetical protein
MLSFIIFQNQRQEIIVNKKGGKCLSYLYGDRKRSAEVGFLKHHGQDVDSRKGLRWRVGSVEKGHVFS